MIATITDWAPSIGAVSTRRPLDSVCCSKVDMEPSIPTRGERTRQGIEAQPDWLRAVPTDRRFPDGARPLFTGCGTSFHAAQTGGDAVQALELVLRPREADILVAVSHEGETRLTLEAPPEVERGWAHTATYTWPVGAIAALHGEDVSWLPDAAASAGAFEPSRHERFLVAGAGRDWATAQEAALKLREGAFVAAEAYETEQLLHGYFAAIDESVRAFVLEGDGWAAERAQDPAGDLAELGSEVTLMPTRHPVPDIVPFQRLTVALAELRGVDPDRIRRDDERWARGAAATRETPPA